VNNIENLVVLTGDIHTSWANNLEKDSQKVGVEFVATSITTMNSPVALPASVISAANAHIKYVDLVKHGYHILDINQERVQADFNYVGNIEDPNDNSSTEGPYWYCSDATRELAESNTASIPRSEMPILLPPNACMSPEDTSGTGISEEPIAAVFGTYPNPFWDDFLIKTYLFKRETVTIEVFDMLGALVTSVPASDLPIGLHYLEVDASGLPKGTYLMKMTVGNKVFSRTVLKI
jgi:alkaline phosphatase D